MQGHHGPEKRTKTSFSSTDQQLFRDFRRIKAKGEKRKLDSAEVSIQQAGKSILVSGLSDNTTHDAIQLHFESGKSSGGPVRRVQFVAKRDMERVLATHEGEPHVLNQGELSIGIYPEFLESEKVGVRDDWGGLVTTAGGADKAHVSQQSAAKTQQLDIAVDPDVMEFVTTTAFHDELNNSLAAKRSEITWKPNNKMAVIVYRGGHDSDSWHSQRIDEVQNYLGKFAKRDVQVNKDFWGAVVAQLSSIPACLGEDPLLVKTIDQAFVVRLVSLSTDVEDYEKKLRFKLEEIYREETRKTLRVYVPKERLILLKKIKFVEKLQEKNKKLKIKPDTEGEGIYFEGSERHINEATEMLQNQISDMVEKKLTLSVSNLKVLDSEEGLMKVKCELESNNVEAVFVIDKDTRVVGTSAAHADSAAWLVKKLLESDSIREEQFICSSPIVRGYLYECRQEDLRSIESQLKYFKVKINKGKGNDDFDISGNKEGLIRARRKLDCLMKDTTSETFDVKQPGLRKFFDSGKGDRLVKSVEKDHNCAIQVQKNFGQRWDDLRSLDSASSGSGDDDSDVDDDEDVTAVSGSDVFTLVMTHGQHKISWRPGNIETEKADVLVSSVGASSKAMVNVDVLAMANPNVGDITVNSGLPLTKHVIHTNCCQWQGGQGEVTLQAIVQKCLLKGEQLGARSIAFPVIGTGNLNFPRHAASRIMLEETISFCQANPVSKVQDIRFIVFQQDQTLTVAFKQEIDRLITKHKLSPVYPKSGLINKIQSRFKRLRVSRGGVCRETTNSYPWANDTDDIVHICVLGKKTGVEKAVESLKKGFSEACTTQNVTNEAISQLSRKQIDSLRRKAEDRDVKLEVEADANCIVVQGQPTEVSAMIGEIWKEISERTKKTQENEQAQLVSRNIEWSCEMRGTSMAFGRKANAKIEMACSKDEPRVHVSLRGEQFVIDLKAKTGRVQRTGEQITLKRKVKGAEEGIPLPEHWDPMPSINMTVHTVELSPSSFEYQAVLLRFQATVDGVTILKIERIQNPHLYQCYTVRKQKMDKDIGGNSERQLFHGTDAKNVSHINTQGFNRSLCGAHGVKYGRGVYFARDARCSLGYARGGVGARHMYLARVLVGQYCVGHSSMMVPPPKNTWRPEILYESVVDNQGNPSSFVVFCDNQCYPEYLITMQQ